MSKNIKPNRNTYKMKRIFGFFICWLVIAPAFTNCSSGFQVASDLGGMDLQSSISDLELSFDPLAQDVMTNANPVVAFSVKASLSTYILKCYVNGLEMTACSSPLLLASQQDGDLSVRVVAQNINGRILKEISRVFRVDRQAPVVSILSKPANQIGAQNTSVQFSVMDNLSSAADIQVQCSLDNAVFANCASPVNYNNLAIGSHSVQIKATDSAGNVSNPTLIQFSIVIGIPTVNISASPAGYINTTTAAFSFAGTSATSTISGYECSIDGGATYATCSSPKSYTGLANGTYNFAVRAKDTAGQFSGSAMSKFTVDTVLPSRPVVSSNLTSPSKENSLSLTFISTDASGIASYQCSLDGSAFSSCTSPKAYPGLGMGSHLFKVKSTDLASNVSTEGSYSIILDNVAPTITLTAVPANPTTETNATFQFTIVDADAGVNTVECQLDTESTYSPCTSPKGYMVNKGNRTFAVRASDKAGNSSIKSFSWTVTDVVSTPTPAPGGGPLTSIDTGTDPNFANGAANLSVSGNKVTITATRSVQTAAGIFKSDGTLVRTLWRKINLTAGQTTSLDWDYKDDLGGTVSDGAYQVKAIAHNVEFKWQGVIGNTSNPGAAGEFKKTYDYAGIKITVDTIGDKIHRGFSQIMNLTFDAAGNGFIALGYNEGQNSMHRISVAAPQIRTPLLKADVQRDFSFVTTDGTIAYYAMVGIRGTDYYNVPENFIIGVNVNDNSQTKFQFGSNWEKGLSYQNWWTSVIDLVTDGQDRIQGLAVESNGNNLYVAHSNTGIKILNKTTGECRIKSTLSGTNCSASIAVPNPGPIAMAPNGDLWVVSNKTELRKYTNPGSNPQLALTIPGFSKLLAIGISPVTSTVVAMDTAVDQQQLKAYNAQTGAALWVHGQKGGYSAANGPAVTSNKFHLQDAPNNFVAFEPAQGGNEYFWVGDTGNYRNIKFQLPSNPASVNPLIYKDEIMYVPHSYISEVNKTDPTRVFSGFLEFQVDYSKPITNSWKLVKNWEVGLSDAIRTAFAAGPKDVYTTPQGRTYAIMAILRYEWENQVYELTSNGMRETSVSFKNNARFAENMTARYAKLVDNNYQIFQREFTGVDAKGDPIFSNESMIASIPVQNGVNHNPVHGGCYSGANEQIFHKTVSNMIITFDPCGFKFDGYDPTNSFHLGGFKVGASDYSFRTAPAGSFKIDAAKQILDGDGTFNVANLNQNYAGNIVNISGRHIVYGYHGEFWNNSQANQWMHFLDNGLFVSQFGVAGAGYAGSDVVVGTGGNTFSWSLTNVDGNIYMYHNDEHAQAGVQRWRMANQKSLQEMVGNLGKNTAVTNPASIPSVPMSQ